MLQIKARNFLIMKRQASVNFFELYISYIARNILTLHGNLDQLNAKIDIWTESFLLAYNKKEFVCLIKLSFTQRLSNATLPPIERFSKKPPCSIDKLLQIKRRQQETCTSLFCRKTSTHSDNTTSDQNTIVQPLFTAILFSSTLRIEKSMRRIKSCWYLNVIERLRSKTELNHRFKKNLEEGFFVSQRISKIILKPVWKLQFLKTSPYQSMRH